MSHRNLNIAWLASIAALSVFAGLTWQEVELTAAAGAKEIQVSGFLAFPVISALVLLQASAFLATILTPLVFGRIVAAIFTPILGWHCITVLTTVDGALQETTALEISKTTGIVGLSSQAEFIASSTTTQLWFGYLFFLLVNILVLAAKAISNRKAREPKQSIVEPMEAEDLWESQK